LSPEVSLQGFKPRLF